MTKNELELAKTFREAVGLEQDKAEAIALAIFDAIRSTVATKSDIEVLRATTKSNFETLRAAMGSDIEGLGAATKSDLHQLSDELRVEIRATKSDLAQLGHGLRTEIQTTKSDLTQLRHELRTEIQQLRRELRTDIHRLLWLGIVGWGLGIGIVIAALYYWPPHL